MNDNQDNNIENINSSPEQVVQASGLNDTQIMTNEVFQNQNVVVSEQNTQTSSLNDTQSINNEVPQTQNVVMSDQSIPTNDLNGTQVMNNEQKVSVNTGGNQSNNLTNTFEQSRSQSNIGSKLGNKKLFILIGIGIALVLVIGAFIFMNGNSSGLGNIKIGNKKYIDESRIKGKKYTIRSIRDNDFTFELSTNRDSLENVKVFSYTANASFSLANYGDYYGIAKEGISFTVKDDEKKSIYVSMKTASKLESMLEEEDIYGMEYVEKTDDYYIFKEKYTTEDGKTEYRYDYYKKYDGYFLEFSGLERIDDSLSYNKANQTFIPLYKKLDKYINEDNKKTPYLLDEIVSLKLDIGKQIKSANLITHVSVYRPSYVADYLPDYVTVSLSERQKNESDILTINKDYRFDITYYSNSTNYCGVYSGDKISLYDKEVIKKSDGGLVEVAIPQHCINKYTLHFDYDKYSNIGNKKDIEKFFNKFLE